MEDTPTQTRLPRYKRDPKGFGRFDVTERDIAILSLINDFRFLRSDQIFALMPGSSGRGLAYRLQGMHHHGLVARLLPPLRVREAAKNEFTGSPKHIYALDRAGAELLCAARKISLRELGWHKGQNARMFWFIEHSLAVSGFRGTLELALAARPESEYLGWAGEESLRDSVVVQYPNGEHREFRVAPDGYCAVKIRGERWNLFHEMDRGTEEHPRLTAKFASLWWYLATGSPFFDKFENPKNRLVLVVTTTPKRLHAMLKTLAAIDPKRRGLMQFWFCTARDYSLEDPTSILRPIWRTVRNLDAASSNERKALLS